MSVSRARFQNLLKLTKWECDIAPSLGCRASAGVAIGFQEEPLRGLSCSPNPWPCDREGDPVYSIHACKTHYQLKQACHKQGRQAQKEAEPC